MCWPANPKLGLSTVKDLLAYAKTKDNQHQLPSVIPASGTMGHLCGVLFASKAGLSTAPSSAYRGASAIIVTDLLGGQIDVGIRRLIVRLPNRQTSWR